MVKNIGRISAVTCTLIFIWIMLIAINPIKPQKITNHFQICDINNISTWGATQEKIIKVNTLGILPGDPGDFIEFTFENLSDNSFFSCRFNIPEITLYNASTINIVYRLDQPAKLGIGILRAGQGPFWGPITIPSDSVNKVITSSWPVAQSTGNEPKLNWLSGPYEEITIQVTESDRTKPLVLTIYEVYLE